jgi:hypothetical protein
MLIFKEFSNENASSIWYLVAKIYRNLTSNPDSFAVLAGELEFLKTSRARRQAAQTGI